MAGRGEYWVEFKIDSKEFNQNYSEIIDDSNEKLNEIALNLINPGIYVYFARNLQKNRIKVKFQNISPSLKKTMT
jgi:hypothetical protein